MPTGDRTGPQGAGPLTGRGLGNCSDSTNEDYNIGATRPSHLTFRRGAGTGRRRRGSGSNFRKSNARGR